VFSSVFEYKNGNISFSELLFDSKLISDYKKDRLNDINELLQLKQKFNEVVFICKNKNYIIKKDGNRLGKIKHAYYLNKYFDYMQLISTLNVNGFYGSTGFPTKNKFSNLTLVTNTLAERRGKK